MTIMSAYPPQENHTLALGYISCSRGHSHPPWNTTGVLTIAKCESICGFCQKETKTAANLRKHVAIHIKNDGLNLTIAEGSSGRGRLFVPTYLSHEQGPLTLGYREGSMSDFQCRPASVSSMAISSPTANGFSGPSFLPSMSRRSSSSSNYHKSTSTHSTPSPIASISYTTLPPPQSQLYTSAGPLPYPSIHDQFSKFPSHEPQNPFTHLPLPPIVSKYRKQNDPFHGLRSHNLNTKSAWTAIPASEGQRILEVCKRNSSTSTSTSMDNGSLHHGSSSGHQQFQGAGTTNPPCYNRKTLYDEEWQAHMRDVHGVYLLWPDTWMKRVEVLDLDPFGGDIGACNGVIMDS